MRLFIDTDVLLDVFLNREPHYKMSAGVLDWCENHPREAAVSWHGLANLHYPSSDGARELIDDPLGFTEVPDTGTDSMKQALTLNFKDFEDVMQVAAALRFRADRLVTRNIKDYRNSPIPVVSPSGFLKEVQGSGE